MGAPDTRRPILSTVTRISDLEAAPFHIEALPREMWATGDYVACEAIADVSPEFDVELPSGRMSKAMEGDIVVGAFGTRMATLEGVGGWQAIGEDLSLHALTPAGLFGKATSTSPLRAPLPALHYRGHVVRDGKVTMGEFVEPVEPALLAMPVILLVGTSMSAGKTSSGRTIIHELRRAGLKVAAAKLTGAARYRDVLSFGDAGADPIFDFVDIGLPSTVCPEDEFREKLGLLLSRIARTGADVLVAEAGASPLEPYNGAVAVEMLESNVAMMVLSASDPYAVIGVQHAFSREPDIVSGPAANTDAGIELVKKLCGVPALNLLRRSSLPALRAVLADRLDVFAREAAS